MCGVSVSVKSSDSARALFQAVVLSGGTAMLPGLEDRLRGEKRASGSGMAA